MHEATSAYQLAVRSFPNYITHLHNISFAADGDHLPQAAQSIINLLTLLASPPTNARHILVLDDYGRGTETASGDAFKQSVFSGLNALHNQQGLAVGYVDFKTIWDGVLNGPPGFAAFGYTSPGTCLVNDSSTVGDCSDPEHTFYWIDGCVFSLFGFGPGEHDSEYGFRRHPSKETHRIMADYAEEVLTDCVMS